MRRIEMEWGTRKDRRRTCADRVRANVITAANRRGNRSPATSAFIQLLTLTSILVNALPVLDFSWIAPPEPLPEPEPERPAATPVEPRTYKKAPSWPMLVRDLARPVANEMARKELYARLPAEACPWLDEVIKNADWSALRVHAQSGATDESVSAAVLADVQRWRADKETAPAEALDAAGGAVAAGSKPGGRRP